MSENNTSLPRLNDQILKYFNDLLIKYGWL